MLVLHVLLSLLDLFCCEFVDNVVFVVLVVVCFCIRTFLG